MYHIRRDIEVVVAAAAAPAKVEKGVTTTTNCHYSLLLLIATTAAPADGAGLTCVAKINKFVPGYYLSPP